MVNLPRLNLIMKDQQVEESERLYHKFRILDAKKQIRVTISSHVLNCKEISISSIRDLSS